MRYKKEKINKYTMREINRKKREDALKGEGEYLFVNSTRGDLKLEKPPIKGVNPVPQGQSFVGDSYFFCLMKEGMIRLIETIKAPERKEIMSEQKLILDQPEKFTNQGQIEHVVPETKPMKLVETPQKSTPKNKLLTEDPLDGVEIILS